MLRAVKYILIITVTIAIVAFLTSNFNSERSYLQTAKDIYADYKLSNELKKAETPDAIYSVSVKATEILDTPRRNELRLSAVKKLSDLSANTQDHATSTGTQSTTSQQQTKQEKEAEATKKYKKQIILSVADDTESALSSVKSPKEKDELLNRLTTTLDKLNLDKEFEQSLENKQNYKILKEGYYLQKIASLLKKQKLQEARKYVGKIQDDDLKSLLLFVTDKPQNLQILSGSDWLYQLELRISKIRALAREEKFFEAKMKTQELKTYLKQIRHIYNPVNE